MPEIFAQGTVLYSLKGQEIHVDGLLSRGEGAAVYAVTVNAERKQLRWFLPENGHPVPESLRESTREKLEGENPGKYFFWPEDMVETPEDGFGYVTRPDAKDAISFRQMPEGGHTFPGWRETLNVGIRMALAFAALHEKGYCVSDHGADFRVTPGGSVLFPETEAIVPAGQQETGASLPAYTAPELLREEARPDEKGDRYALGVYLFGLFGLGHPLEGMRHLVPLLTPEVERQLYEQAPLFLFDPDDPDNRPHPVLHRGVEDAWNKLPDYTQDLFLRIFSREGLADPGNRPTEAEWIFTLCRMKHDRRVCACGKELFDRASCPFCGKPLPKTARLVSAGFSLPVIRGRKLYRCLLGETESGKMMEPAAVIVEDEQRPGTLRLKNTGGTEWTAFTPSGAEKKVQREETVPVMPGITIFMDGVEVKIENS